jgi:D-alanine-D-alanine ligase-like ATP-grasp enzyme
MNSIYTTTLTTEARRRGCRIKVCDPQLPIFELTRGKVRIRCYNALTDRVGAATFFLAQNKGAANRFLRSRGFPAPDQIVFTGPETAERFVARHRTVVVKPASQWGGRGVSVDVRTPAELRKAIAFAHRYEDEILIEQKVAGIDYRLIFVDYRFVAAIRRDPARVTGNGRDTIRQLIRTQNRIETRTDPSHRIPVDRETLRALDAQGLGWETIVRAGRSVAVRRTSNYHTGGSVEMATTAVPPSLVRLARRVARLLKIPVLGIDFLYDPRRRRGWIIELSPDLAISPPEGEEVAQRFMDYLFPTGKRTAGVRSGRQSSGR